MRSIDIVAGLLVAAATVGLVNSEAMARLKTSTPRIYSETTPRIVRIRSVSQVKALRAMQQRAVSNARELHPLLERHVGPTTLVTVRLAVGDAVLRLRLAEYEPDLSEGQVLEQLHDGSWTSRSVQRSGTRFYIGRVTNHAGSLATLYRTETAGWGGSIKLEEVEYLLEPMGWTVPTTLEDGNAASFIFRREDTEEFLGGGQCGNGGPSDVDGPTFLSPPPSSRHVIQNQTIERYKVTYVASDDYWAARGGSDDIVGDEIVRAHYSVSHLMQEQLWNYGIALHANWIVLHSNLPAPPFTNPDETDSGILLDDLLECKGSPCLNGILNGSGRIAVLLVARPALHKPSEPGLLVGIASIRSLCSGSAAAVVETTGNNHDRFVRVAHELGHVFGACHDGPVPGNGCSTPTGCNNSGYLMSPTIGAGTVAAYSSCSVNLMNAKIGTTEGCRQRVYCGDVNADAVVNGVCFDDSVSAVTTTDALLALKISTGQISPVGYSHLADVESPFGVIDSVDALSLMKYAVCDGEPDQGVPPDCGN